MYHICHQISLHNIIWPANCSDVSWQNIRPMLFFLKISACNEIGHWAEWCLWITFTSCDSSWVTVSHSTPIHRESKTQKHSARLWAIWVKIQNRIYIFNLLLLWFWQYCLALQHCVKMSVQEPGIRGGDQMRGHNTTQSTFTKKYQLQMDKGAVERCRVDSYCAFDKYHLEPSQRSTKVKNHAHE